MDIRKAMEYSIIYLDGAMGTMVQRAGLKAGHPPEIYNMTNPDVILSIHRAYLQAGADVITTNTFGANQYKLANTGYTVEEVVEKAVSIAREAAGERWVALDIGPVGQLMEPSGSLTFEEVYESVARQVRVGADSGADLVIIETLTDIYEAKAAVLAAKENSSLPVFCTLTFDKSGRTLMGTDPLTAVTILEALGVDALGVNCSLGPKDLLPIIEEFLKYSHVPVIAQPNAGLPKLENGETKFEMSPEEFAQYAKQMVDKGVRVIGGCCGTSPEFIEAVRKATSDANPLLINNERITAASSSSKTVVLGRAFKIIGERINPTGKEDMAKALKEKDFYYIVDEAIEQREAGADILDVNVCISDIDEKETMVQAIREIQSMVNIPLQIDSTDPEVIEAAVRICNGKPIINSVSGTKASMEAIFPIAKKYGTCLIALTLDEKGIPASAEERFEIAANIVDEAEKWGISRENIIIDCLVLTASNNQREAMETLKAIELVKKELKTPTILGISNVSYGLPNRSLLNRTYLAMALAMGLDAAILNPLDRNIIETLHAFKVLSGSERDIKEYIKLYR